MSAAPKVSVLMTVYNAGRHLGPAIRSVLRQDFRDFEFIIVDDASTDESRAEVERFARDDARIRLVANGSNKGQTACLNKGLRECRADWVARQDADDLSLPGRLAAQWDVVRACPDLALVGVNGWIIDGDDQVAGAIHAPLYDRGIRWALPFRNPFIHTGVMFRRRKEVFYDESLRICQDWDLWARLLETGRGCNHADRLVAYRHSEHSLSHASVDRTEAESAAIVAGIWRRKFGSDPADGGLLASFRRGLRVDERADFWHFYREVRQRGGAHGTAQAAAVHHVQVAGGMLRTSRAAFASEMLAAFSEAPGWTLRVLADAVRRPRRIRI